MTVLSVYSVIFASNSGGIRAYLGEAADLFDRHVESEEIKRLASHCGQVVHAHGLLLSEGQVSIHPHLPLWLWAKLVQTSDLLVGDGRRARLLQDRQWEKIMRRVKKKKKKALVCDKNFTVWI